MEFEWNAKKAETNKVKHRLSFGTATAVFEDPNEITERSPYPLEVRFQTIGQVMPGIIITVIFTYRGSPSQPKIRLISARKASREERHRYEQQRK